jgi:hypothetical protein
MLKAAEDGVLTSRQASSEKSCKTAFKLRFKLT